MNCHITYKRGLETSTAVFYFFNVQGSVYREYIQTHTQQDATFFLKKERFITQTVYTGCKRINYKSVPVTIFNKYLHYGTSGNE